MIRTLAIVASVVLAGAVSASAQSHEQSHPQGLPHDRSGHAPMDPAQHAALHAPMHGHWHGAMTEDGGLSTAVDATVTTDETGKLTLRMTGDSSAHLGATSRLSIDGETLPWRQDISGTSCGTVANVIAATAEQPATLHGSMSCADGMRTLTLHRINQ